MSLRIRLEGAWERLEHLARELPRLGTRDVLADRKAVIALLEQHKKLPPLRSLQGRSPELDALVQQVDEGMSQALSALGFGAPAELRAALEEEVLAEVPSTGWRSLLKPGRFVLTRRRLWWKGETTRSWPAQTVDPKELPELARVSVENLHLLQSLAALYATPLFRDAKLGEPDRSRILVEATRLGCEGDVVLMGDALLFIPQVPEAWSFACGEAGRWRASVSITALVHELLKLPKAESDAALWRAAQHRDALVIRAGDVPERHFVEAGSAWFGGVDDGVLVRMSADEHKVLLAHLKSWGVDPPRTRAEYLRDVQKNAAHREDPKADALSRVAALERDGGQARKKVEAEQWRIADERLWRQAEIEQKLRESKGAEKAAREKAAREEAARAEAARKDAAREQEVADLERQIRALQERRDSLLRRRR